MDNTYRQLSIRIGSALTNTLELRKDIVELAKKEKLLAFDGVIALSALSVGQAKEMDITRDEFLGLCNMLYNSISLLNDGQEDIIMLPEHQNN